MKPLVTLMANSDADTKVVLSPSFVGLTSLSRADLLQDWLIELNALYRETVLEFRRDLVAMGAKPGEDLHPEDRLT